MKIEELYTGQPVTLEIVWGGTSYEIMSQIHSHQDDKVAIKPFTYNGVMVSMFKRRMKDMVFNLYCMDSEGRRTCWNDVNIFSEMKQGSHYYIIETGDENRESLESERREFPRMNIGVNGKVFNESGIEIGEITLHDISDSGISFIYPTNNLPKDCVVNVKWVDHIKDKDVSLDEKVQIIRASKHEEGYKYGCKLLKKDRNLLMYILIKQMDEREDYI